MPKTAQNPPYRIETERLEMRCWSPADAPLFRAALDQNDSHLRPLIPFMRHEPRSLFDTAQWLRRIRAQFDNDQNYRYALFASKRLIGEAMILDRYKDGQLEVGYWIDSDSCGKGYATEATAACVRVAFHAIETDRVDLACAPENAASASVARKLGFTHEATLRRRTVDTEDKFRDLMIFSLLKSEFDERPAAALAADNKLELFDSQNESMD